MSTGIYAASVALVRRDDLLVVQRALAPWSGAWSLPGGRLEMGEDAETCAIREIREELALTIFALRPVTHLAVGPNGQRKLAVFATKAFEGEIVASTEIAAWRWVRPEQLGTLRTTPHLGAVVEKVFRLFGRR